jgi:hypothetical protein
MIQGWVASLPRAAQSMTAIAIPDHLVQLLAQILPEPEPVLSVR